MVITPADSPGDTIGQPDRYRAEEDREDTYRIETGEDILMREEVFDTPCDMMIEALCASNIRWVEEIDRLPGLIEDRGFMGAEGGICSKRSGLEEALAEIIHTSRFASAENFLGEIVFAESITIDLSGTFGAGQIFFGGFIEVLDGIVVAGFILASKYREESGKEDSLEEEDNEKQPQEGSWSTEPVCKRSKRHTRSRKTKSVAVFPGMYFLLTGCRPPERSGKWFTRNTCPEINSVVQYIHIFSIP
jgi:hypothetical protein